ncbi:MAG: PAS domain-containing protein [Candidatus Zixiibacteriota bacterium]|nr:MAG: PAS domain-containing protein [candidate division Zixibacteria bacterium]
MKQKPIGKLPLFYGLKLRHAIALLTCLAVILIFAGYFSVKVGQNAAFDALTSQGRALTESLLSSADIIIEADDEFIELGLDQLMDKIPLESDEKLRSDSALDSLRILSDADRICFIDNNKIMASSLRRNSIIGNNEIEVWIDSLAIDPEAQIIYELRETDGDRYLWSFFPFDNEAGLFVSKKWLLGKYGNQKLSLYYLLNQVAQESGVEYIMLQNLEGIIFASKKIASMPRISDDEFLLESLDSDTTRSRVIPFQDREVLETVSNFKSKEFEGLFRVGLSMYGYRKIAGGMKRQVWFVVAALIIVGMIGFATVVGYQNYDLLKAGLLKASAISQSLLDSIPGPVAAIDSKNRITDINSAARSCFGLQAGYADGKDYFDLFPKDPFRFKNVISGKRSAGFENSMGQDGERYFVTSTPLFAMDGSVIGAIAVAQNITAARKLEEMAESRRRLSEMGALAASMAHEIRNPLNAIGITIQRMKNEIKPADKEDNYRRFMDGLRQEITRLNSIIEKFLAVARSVRPEMTSISSDDLIRRALGLFAGQAESLKIKINYAGQKDYAFEGDRDGLIQALVNVIKNSVEAIGENGNIDISVNDIDDKIIISIADNGPGIEDTALVLKPFHTTKSDGTGLGLSTASKIITDHGGELIIESSPGQGCRVDFVIPCKRSKI